MKRYLLIKIGISNLMGQLIIKALNPLIHYDTTDNDLPKIYNTSNAMMMLNFQSASTIDELTNALGDYGMMNFIITEVGDNFRARLSDDIDKDVRLNTVKAPTGKSLEEMSAEELQLQLDYALSMSLFERAATIRDIMKSSVK